MDGGAHLDPKAKALTPLTKDRHTTEAVVIPTSTAQCVIVKTFKTPVSQVKGTIKFQTQLDGTFSIFLRGKCTEEQFQHTIGGINWFANLLHEAEVEFYAEAYSNSPAWKDYHQSLVTEEIREKVLTSHLTKNNVAYKSRRSRIAGDVDMKTYSQLVIGALHDFIDDENHRIYFKQGVQWTYPERNHWRWLEIQILPTGPLLSEMLPTPLLDVPASPNFGDSLKFEVIDTLSLDDHTEYVVHIICNLKEWYPIVDTYILRRFNDFKAFYDTITAYMEEHSLEVPVPRVREGSFIGRNSKSTLLERKTLFQDLLEAIAASAELRNSPPVHEFFGVQTDLQHWKYHQYLERKQKP